VSLTRRHASTCSERRSLNSHKRRGATRRLAAARRLSRSCDYITAARDTFFPLLSPCLRFRRASLSAKLSRYRPSSSPECVTLVAVSRIALNFHRAAIISLGILGSPTFSFRRDEFVNSHIRGAFEAPHRMRVTYLVTCHVGAIRYSRHLLITMDTEQLVGESDLGAILIYRRRRNPFSLGEVNARKSR